MIPVHKDIPHDTVADCQHREGGWELWQGRAVSLLPSPFGRHAKLLINLGSALKVAIRKDGCDATVLAGIDWIVSSDTVLRPDLTVVCGAEQERHVERPPAPVAEILSISTRTRGLEFKRMCYEKQGVGC